MHGYDRPHPGIPRIARPGILPRRYEVGMHPAHGVAGDADHGALVIPQHRETLVLGGQGDDIAEVRQIDRGVYDVEPAFRSKTSPYGINEAHVTLGGVFPSRYLIEMFFEAQGMDEDDEGKG